MEISPFLDRKLQRRFQTFDSDGDGYIEREDFVQSASRMSEEFGHGPQSPARKLLEVLSAQLWGHLAAAADADEDGRISAAEYKTAFAAGLLETLESFEASYLPFLNAIMDIADTGGDRRLTADEQVRWTKSLMNLPEEDGRDVFRRLD